MDRSLGQKSKPSTVWALSIHADYRCRHSGRVLHGALGRADGTPGLSVAQRRRVTAGACASLRAAAGLDPFIVEPDLPDGRRGDARADDAGACVFFERDVATVHRSPRSGRGRAADNVPALPACGGAGSRAARSSRSRISARRRRRCCSGTTCRSRSSRAARRFRRPITTA